MTGSAHPKRALGRAEHWLGRASASILPVLLALFAVIRIEGAVIATGQTVVEGKPRPVQSADGGVVAAIHVADGDVVTAGDVLARLDPSLLEVNRDILRGRLAELAARRARLEAEEIGLGTIAIDTLPEEIDEAALVSHLIGQTRVFEARRDVLEGQQAQLAERIAQYRNRTEGLTAQIIASREKAHFLDQEIANLETLKAKGLAPQSRLLELQGRRAAEAATLITLQSDAAANVNAIRDAELQISQAESTFREAVTTELREAITSYEETRLELLRTAQQLDRLNIRAPVGGVIHELQLASAGSVLAPQEVMLTVIPASRGVEFSLQIAPDAIDSVYPGQTARLRFPAFDQKSTPEIFGRIARISPDAVRDPGTGQTFFRVFVTVPQDELARLGAQALVPGMPIEALLQTGARSILSYLAKPLTDQIAHAFRES